MLLFDGRSQFLCDVALCVRGLVLTSSDMIIYFFPQLLASCIFFFQTSRMIIISSKQEPRLIKLVQHRLKLELNSLRKPRQNIEPALIMALYPSFCSVKVNPVQPAKNVLNEQPNDYSPDFSENCLSALFFYINSEVSIVLNRIG